MTGAAIAILNVELMPPNVELPVPATQCRLHLFHTFLDYTLTAEPGTGCLVGRSHPVVNRVLPGHTKHRQPLQIGRASCRERGGSEEVRSAQRGQAIDE